MGTPAEVAGVLRVSVKTLSNWRWRGVGPAWVKAGHSVRYQWSEVRKYQQDNRKGSGT
jgi:hypothetical protein